MTPLCLDASIWDTAAKRRKDTAPILVRAGSENPTTDTFERLFGRVEELTSRLKIRLGDREAPLALRKATWVIAGGGPTHRR